MNRPRLVSMLLLATGFASTASANPLLSEVFYDAVGSDAGRVFVELSGAPGSSLEGLTLEGVNGSDGSVTVSLSLSGSFPADGLFVVADGAAGMSEVAEADLVLDFDFQNGPDSVRLLSGASVLDALGYGSFGASDVFAGEGSPAPDAPAGDSLARHFANLDADDNASDFAVGPPSPGSAPFAAIPEPSTVWLTALGLAGLAGGRRRRRHGAPGAAAGAAGRRAGPGRRFS